ncbi:SDR family NAD(P)-dependent oxidoreductase [Azospirillum sp. Sh1]|uniref:SDR family NAD(P)-dependent oxidoreductase n=1 Tax=Azospirillum sp. Sh1 TaxID=2607285 RepID=UPI001B3B7B6C|nr:SDR family NAD(P)-dependent oxidoreductase [Azospirillum sp. Sh1]
MKSNDQRVWLVTGCSTGFGRHIAGHLLDIGQKVVVTARKPHQIQDLARRGDALILPLDVTDPAQTRDAVQQAEARFGRVDVLVNNAGIGYFAAVEESDEALVRAMFDVNLFGAASTIRAVLPGMRRRRSGTIVNLTSVGGLEGFPAVGFYCATKYAVEGLSDSLRIETAPLGIHVMTVSPAPSARNGPVPPSRRPAPSPTTTRPRARPAGPIVTQWGNSRATPPARRRQSHPRCCRPIRPSACCSATTPTPWPWPSWRRWAANSAPGRL